MQRRSFTRRHVALHEIANTESADPDCSPEVGRRVVRGASLSPSTSPEPTPSRPVAPLRKNKRMLGLRPTPPSSKRGRLLEKPSRPGGHGRGTHSNSAGPSRDSTGLRISREHDVESLGSTACSPASSVLGAVAPARGSSARAVAGPALSPPVANGNARSLEPAAAAAATGAALDLTHGSRADSKPVVSGMKNQPSVASRGKRGVAGTENPPVAPASPKPKPPRRESSPLPDPELSAVGLDSETISMLKFASLADSEGIVWTKIKGHPYWPSQVVKVTRKLAEEKRFKDAEKFKRSGDETCVQYFGTLEIAWVDRSKSCISWETGIRKKLHTVLQKRAAYVEALEEVRGYCGRQTKYPRGWWCEPTCFVLESKFLQRFASDDESDEEDQRSPNDDEKLWSVARAERVVWAKVRGFPEWPVQIIPRAEASSLFPELKLSPQPSKPARSPKTPSGSLPCMFFGTGEVANIPEKSMTEFEAGVKDGFFAESDARDFRIALGEVYGFLQIPRVWPSGFASSRLWWNAPDEGTTDEEDATAKVPASVPKYEFLRRSVWPEGESPPPRTRRGEVPVCICTPKRSGSCVDGSCWNHVSRIICDPVSCPAGVTCKNVSFHRRPKRPLRPFYTADGRGWGLRTAKRILKGEFVVEYVGEIIDKTECERRLKSRPKHSGSDYYMMEISSDHVLDARLKGNLSRFINSSCAPNCATQKWTDAATGQTRVGIFAVEDIPAGSELLYDYCFQDFGLASKKGERSFTCRCGAPTCCMYREGEYERVSKVVGRRIKVKWDDGWYPGVVKRYDPADKAFDVLYDDGDTERLGLGENPAVGGDIAFKLLPKAQGNSS